MGTNKQQKMMAKRQMESWLMETGRTMAGMVHVGGILTAFVKDMEKNYMEVAGAMREEMQAMQECYNRLDKVLHPLAQLLRFGVSSCTRKRAESRRTRQWGSFWTMRPARRHGKR